MLEYHHTLINEKRRQNHQAPVFARYEKEAATSLDNAFRVVIGTSFIRKRNGESAHVLPPGGTAQ
jgi:hypothetical protein